MPYVKVELLEGRTDDQKAKIARIVTDALVEHGGAKPDSVFVVFDDVAPQNWASGGQLISERRRAAAQAPGSPPPGARA